MNPANLIREHVRALAAYTPGEQPKQPGLIKLNTNENPYPPSPEVGKVLAGFTPADLRLYPDPVSQELRDELARLNRVEPAQVFVGNGSDEALALCTRAFVEPGQSIGYLDPSYSLYPVLAAIQHVPVHPVALDDAFQWTRFDVDPSCRLFFITQPNAPTGMLHDRESIRAFCGSFPGVVLIDEAYADFARETCMDLVHTFENVLVSRSFSKSYSLAGLRLGYVVGSAPLIAALHKIKDSYNVNMLTQRLGLAAVRDQAYMKATVAKVLATRTHVATTLTERGYQVFPSETNFLWIKPPRETAADLFVRLRAANILTRHFTAPRIADYLRVTIGTDDQMARFLELAAD
ncbi:MAG TPA: histidinol-phosphate transaminase [Kiritimatiellia bacterium]|nr:histidinol-phosphate transaminase [Kiritimatiellia bacterium]